MIRIRFIEPFYLEYVRLRCETPGCEHYYLARPGNPIKICFNCLRKKEMFYQHASVFVNFFNPVHVYNRYDRPCADILR